VTVYKQATKIRDSNFIKIFLLSFYCSNYKGLEELTQGRKQYGTKVYHHNGTYEKKSRKRWKALLYEGT